MANIDAGTREITGLVTAARIVREEGRSIVYALTLRPWLWLATKNQDCRLSRETSHGSTRGFQAVFVSGVILKPSADARRLSAAMLRWRCCSS